MIGHAEKFSILFLSNHVMILLNLQPFHAGCFSIMDSEHMHSQNEKKWNVLKKTSKMRFVCKGIKLKYPLCTSVPTYFFFKFLFLFFSIYYTYICTYTLLTSNMMLTPFLCSTEKHSPFIHFYLDSFIFPFF